MECPKCGSTRVQFRSKNLQTLIVKYKCLKCNKVFETKEKDIIGEYIV